MSQISFQTRQQITNVASQCFNIADQDRNGAITIYQFYNFLQLVFQKISLHRTVNQSQCQQLFRFYDDDRNGFLTPNQIIDIVWDIYSNDIANDRIAYQQMLQKIIITKLYNRPYNSFDTNNLYGHWGQSNTKGDWRQYRFNPYQMQQMKKYGYQFTKNPNHNNYQNMGVGGQGVQGGRVMVGGGNPMMTGAGGFNQAGQGGFNQQTGMGQGFNQAGGFNQGGQGFSNQGGFNQQGMGMGQGMGFNQGGINLSGGQGFNNQGGFNQGMAGGWNQGKGLGNQGGYSQGGFNQGGFNQQSGGFNQGMGGINLSAGGMNMSMNMQPGINLSGGQGFNNQGGFNQNTSGGFSNQGFNQGGINLSGGQGFNNQGFNNQGGFNSQGQMGNFGNNQFGANSFVNNGGFSQYQHGYHRPNPNSEFGYKQLMMDPFSWNEIPQFKADQNIALPSPSQLTMDEQMINLQALYEMSNYLQVQQVTLVTPIRSRNMSQMQALQYLKQLPYECKNHGYGNDIHFKALYVELVNLIEGRSF